MNSSDTVMPSGTPTEPVTIAMANLRSLNKALGNVSAHPFSRAWFKRCETDLEAFGEFAMYLPLCILLLPPIHFVSVNVRELFEECSMAH